MLTFTRRCIFCVAVIFWVVVVGTWTNLGAGVAKLGTSCLEVTNRPMDVAAAVVIVKKRVEAVVAVVLVSIAIVLPG